MDSIVTGRLNAEGIGGLIICAIGSLLMWWTFYRELPPGAAIVPRLACGAMTVGGAAMLIRNLFGRSTARVTLERSEAAMALMVLASLATFGWLMLHVGFASGTFLFLMAWWLGLHRRAPDRAPAWAHPSTLAIVAVLVCALTYIVFILLMDMYLPKARLF